MESVTNKHFRIIVQQKYSSEGRCGIGLVQVRNEE